MGVTQIKSRLTNIARNLRTNMTDAERLLWKYLRKKQLEGVRFRRQYPIGNYIADFICLERRIVIEIDGGQHGVTASATARDTERDRWFTERDFKVLRFWNNDVFRNTNGVLEVIRQTCHNPPPS